jgi:hypothetical protein
MEEAKIELELKGLDASLLLTCPECRHVTKLPMGKAPIDKRVTCPCGVVYEIRDKQIKAFQDQLDGLKRTLQKFGK